jgi:4-aminobutyrate aminotransferase-like enzyme
LYKADPQEIIRVYGKYLAKLVSEPFPIVLTHGRGVYLTDVQGNAILISGLA